MLGQAPVRWTTNLNSDRWIAARYLGFSLRVEVISRPGMPLCTSCTHTIPYLYTVYQSAHNLRLEQCTACNTFADPYVERDSLTLLLDLILLKRGVYRHLLYNRGTEPRKASGVNGSSRDEGQLESKRRKRERQRWLLILQLGGMLLLVDAFIRWTHLKSNRNGPAYISQWTRESVTPFLRTLVGCFVETVAFHSGIMLSCYVVSELLDHVLHSTNKQTLSASGIRQEFRFSLIPLTLLYSSMSKLFLLFLLSIWRPTYPGKIQNAEDDRHASSLLSMVLSMLDDDKLDREWVVRNVLGGMSAGFGLRVIFDWHPAFTTLIIFVGWAMKTLVSRVVSGWVGGSEQAGQVWLAYSIP